MLADGLHEVLYGGGDQTLRHLPPVRVTSPQPTYLIEDLFEETDSATRSIASGNTTLAGGDTTTNADAGLGTTNPRRLQVLSAANFAVGDYVQVQSAAGTEHARIAHIAGSVLLLAHELAAVHLAGATVQGTELRATFPSARAADEVTHEEERPLRIVWTYTIGTTLYKAREQIRVVKFRFRDQDLAAIEQSVRDLYPAVVLHMAAKANNLRDTIRSAVRTLRARLDALGVDVGQWMPGTVGHELAVAKVLEVIALNGVHPNGFNSETFLDAARAEFAHTWKNLTGRPKNVVDVQRDGDVANTAHTTALRNPTLRP